MFSQKRMECYLVLDEKGHLFGMRCISFVIIAWSLVKYVIWSIWSVSNALLDKEKLSLSDIIDVMFRYFEWFVHLMPIVWSS